LRFGVALRGYDQLDGAGGAEEFDAGEFRPTVTSLTAPTARSDGAKPAATMTHWLNTKSNVRHNAGCRWYGKTKDGRYCSADEGKPCGECGG
jgi:hypothetical protein